MDVSKIFKNNHVTQKQALLSSKVPASGRKIVENWQHFTHCPAMNINQEMIVVYNVLI